MKNITLTQKLFVFFSFITVVYSCTKTETIYVQQPTACFTILGTDYFDSHKRISSTNYIDSNFYFKNCSDTGASITYHWDFGDGITSNEKNPIHNYRERGLYPVTLIVSDNNRAFDTSQQTISVILGQQHISFGESTNASSVAIEETETNEFVLLSSTGFAPSFHLIQLDSLLKQKSIKTFPSNYRLASMKSANDGKFIFTGSTQSTSKTNELIKMSADGTILWNKVLSSEDGYSYAAPTFDGGIAVVGLRPTPGSFGSTNYNTIVVKTDNIGNLQWQKTLDGEAMSQTQDAVIEQDGIVVAGVKRNITGACSDCDSLLIVKLDYTGNTIWKNTVLWGLNTSNWWGTHTTKLKNGNYVVTNEYTRGIFIFSPSGNFLDRKLTQNQVRAIADASDGNFLALQNEWGNGNRISVTKLLLDGYPQWYTYPEGRQKLPNGYSCCSDSYAATITPLRTGGTLITGSRRLNNSTGYNSHQVILLWELDEAGKTE